MESKETYSSHQNPSKQIKLKNIYINNNLQQNGVNKYCQGILKQSKEASVQIFNETEQRQISEIMKS